MQHDKELLYISIGKLVSKKISGTITDAEELQLNDFIHISDEHLKVYQELINDQSRSELLETTSEDEGLAAFQRFEQNIIPPAEQHTRLWKRIVVAAAVILVAAFAIYLFNSSQDQKQNSLTRTIGDVAPGGNRATLQLASGKVIALDSISNGLIANEQGMTITKGVDGQINYSIKNNGDIQSGYNTVTTPEGGTYQVRLPDGSTVWLNAGSSLTYAPSLREREDGKRRVSLTGEGYFEVSKDKQHPFIVTTRGQQVEVLGTHFNINGYKDESAVRTTLLEGSVRVHSLSSVKTADKILRPGQQAVLTGSSITVAQADTETVTAWKDGLFVFKDADVPTIMRQLSRWYNVEVEYSSTVPSNLITGGINRNTNLTTAMKMLELVGIKYQLVLVGTTKKIIIN